MKNLLIINIFYLSLFRLMNQVFASQSECESRYHFQKEITPQNQQINSISEEIYQPILSDSKIDTPSFLSYNLPARIEPQGGWNWFIQGSYIYWRANEEGLDVGRALTESSDEIVLAINNPIQMNSAYNAGFRVGIGFETNRDKWETNIKYTRYKVTNTKSKDISALYNSHNYLQSSWISKEKLLSLGLENKYSSEKGKWDLNYNLFEIELCRPFFLGKKLLFKPFFGIRGGWIDQKYLFEGTAETNIIGNNNITLQSKNISNSWFIGPSTGFSSQWPLIYGLSLYGNAYISMYYQKFNVSIQENVFSEILSSENSYELIKKELTQLNPDIELSLGVEYGKYFYYNQWHLNLSLGYDFIYLWNQNMIESNLIYNSKKLKDSILFNSKIGNLMLNGLNIFIRIDF
jgi:hypothetical protein